MLSDAVIGFIRTAVPAAVGALLAYVATRLGVTEPLPDLGPWSVAVATALYWAAAMALAKRWPRAGWLLGYPKAPEYPRTTSSQAASG